MWTTEQKFIDLQTFKDRVSKRLSVFRIAFYTKERERIMFFYRQLVPIHSQKSTAVKK